MVRLVKKNQKRSSQKRAHKSKRSGKRKTNNKIVLDTENRAGSTDHISEHGQISAIEEIEQALERHSKNSIPDYGGFSEWLQDWLPDHNTGPVSPTYNYTSSNLVPGAPQFIALLEMLQKYELGLPIRLTHPPTRDSLCV